MELTAARRLSAKTNASVFKRINQHTVTRNHHPNSAAAAVCKYWLQGRCTRNPCRFLHPNQHYYVWKNPSNNSPPKRKFINNKENCGHNRTALKTEQKALAGKHNDTTERNGVKEKAVASIHNHTTEENGVKEKASGSKHNDTTEENGVKEKASGSKHNDTTEENGVKGESVKCENLRSWFGDKGLSLVAQLEGHSKDVTGIVFPSGSNNLYCGSKDKSLRVWDCNSGQCVDVINFDEECGTLVEEGPWIFAGLRDMIKAWNRETQNAVVIRASGGMVNAITMFEDVLFAGMEDGTILSWKSTSKSSFSDESTSLKGHTGSVLSLIIGAKKLFSGSADCTIRVWDVESLECKHVLNGHSGDVTSVICWDQYLFSGSLDKTIKVWGATASGNIEEVHRHDADDGVLAFFGMHDEEQKPILLCSCKDNGVCIYDLPSFGVRGRIFSRHDVKAIQVGSEGLFFTGDAAGLVSIWKPNGESVIKSL